MLVVAEQKLGPYGKRTETRRIDGKPGVQVEAEVGDTSRNGTPRTLRRIRFT